MRVTSDGGRVIIERGDVKIVIEEGGMDPETVRMELGIKNDVRVMVKSYRGGDQHVNVFDSDKVSTFVLQKNRNWKKL